MATELEELVEFLSSPSSQVTKVAVDIVSGLTGSDDGLRSLSAYAKTLLPALARLLGTNKILNSVVALKILPRFSNVEDISEPAAQALVNLSQNSSLAENMVDMGFVKITMDTLYKPGLSFRQLLVMLLVNLTQSDSGITSLLQVEDEKMQGLYVMKLVRSFCTPSDETSEDEFEHVGSILVNVSKHVIGRKLLMDPKRGILKQIITQYDSASSLRRKGVFGTIRNCCFEAESQVEDLLMMAEFLWPALLLPVAGNKVYSDQDITKMPLELGAVLSIEREPVVEPEIRVQALDAIYLIVLQEAGRRAFWSINGPRIVQVGYEDEENPKVMEAYEQLGSLLINSSGTEEPYTDSSN